MKTPREIAEMIAGRTEQQIGRFEIVREAEIVANECSEMLAEVYVDDARKIVCEFAETDLRIIIPPRFFDDKSEPMADVLDVYCYFGGKTTPWQDSALAEIIESWYTFAGALRETMERKHRDRKLAAEASTEPNPLNLPPRMNTERARKYIPQAIEAGLIKEQSAGRDGFARYKWTECNRALAYFMEKIFCPKGTKDEKLPAKEIEKTFNVKDISAAANRKNDAEQSRQKWRQTIDEILTD